MRVQGSVDVDGVRLLVDVDVPDGMSEVFVTNISPDCLVIPKDRWPISLLELGSMTVQVLQQEGLKTLGDITDEKWGVRLPEHLLALSDEIAGSIQRLRAVALTFEADDGKRPTDQDREGFPIAIGASAEGEVCESSLIPKLERDPLDLLLDSVSLDLPKRLVRILRESLGMQTLRDLITQPRRKVVFAKGVVAEDVSALEAILQRRGIVSWK